LAWIPVEIQGLYIRQMVENGTWDGPDWLLDLHGLRQPDAVDRVYKVASVRPVARKRSSGRAAIGS
jgi:hypothetical protein